MPPLPGQIANVSGKPEDGSLAQLVEQLTFNQLVAGSNPARPTIFSANRFSFLLLRNFSIASQPKDGSLAQLVEQLTFNQLVAGSNPARPTNSERSAHWALFSFLCARRLASRMRSCAGSTESPRRFRLMRSITRRARPWTGRGKSCTTHRDVGFLCDRARYLCAAHYTCSYGYPAPR